MDHWLDDAEQRAWRSLAAVILKLPAELEHALQRDAGLSHIEYWVMALLSEAPGDRLQLSHLAAQANASLSRLSHVVTRLDRRGYVVRERAPDDARATFAVLTEDGRAQVEAAAPDHVATVRELVFDGLSERDIRDLDRICASIAQRLDQARSV
jgi:DNA-binding MarR family transcriptional regulator